jgi:hypothetical protein
MAAPFVAWLGGWLAYVLVNLGRPCGGDGEDYAKPGSPAATFCHHGGQVTLIVAPPVLTLVVGVVVARRADRVAVLWLTAATTIVTALLGAWASRSLALR